MSRQKKPCAMPRRLPLLVLLLPLFLLGCWTLESFSARVRIEADGSYKYFLEGSAAHTATVYALRRAEYEAKAGGAKAGDGKVGDAKAGGAKADAAKADAAKKPKDEPETALGRDLDLARKDPRVQDIVSMGGGRVRFMATGKGSIAGGELVFQEREAPLTYAQGPGGSLSIRLKDAVISRNAQALGLKASGDVSITLAEGIQVLEHNASKTPTVPGGAYRWHLESPSDPAPHLVIRLRKQ